MELLKTVALVELINICFVILCFLAYDFWRHWVEMRKFTEHCESMKEDIRRRVAELDKNKFGV